MPWTLTVKFCTCIITDGAWDSSQGTGIGFNGQTLLAWRPGSLLLYNLIMHKKQSLFALHHYGHMQRVTSARWYVGCCRSTKHCTVCDAVDTAGQVYRLSDDTSST